MYIFVSNLENNQELENRPMTDGRKRSDIEGLLKEVIRTIQPLPEGNNTSFNKGVASGQPVIVVVEDHDEVRRLFPKKPALSTNTSAPADHVETFLQKATSLVKERLEDPDFNVERFTKEICISRTNLYTKIKTLTGKNIVGFIRSLRIEKAIELIRTNSGNMTQIAYSVGFNNRQSFIKSFKLETGKTPSQFKRSELA